MTNYAGATSIVSSPFYELEIAKLQHDAAVLAWDCYVARAQGSPLKVTVGHIQVPLSAKSRTEWFNGIARRLDSLTRLKAGWSGPDSRPVDDHLAADALRLIDEVTKTNTPEPFVNPTASGGVLTEWQVAKLDLSIELTHDLSLVVLFTDAEGIAQDWEQTLHSDLSEIKHRVDELSKARK